MTTYPGTTMTTTTTKMRFDDREFRSSHLKPPRGFGSWAFEFDAGDERPFFVLPAMTFTDAKRAASAEGKRRGAASAVVCP